MAINNIRTSGGIFTHHFIESLQQDTLNHPAVRPEAFTLPGHDRVTQAVFEKAVANSWTSLVERWDMTEREFGAFDITTLRQRWLRPLFYHLNIETEYQRGDTVLEGDLRFPLSHLGRAGTTGFTLPVHSVLYEKEDTLEMRVGTGRGIKTLAPHDMVQRYLNLSKEHDWAIVTDGVYLRLLRDFHHTYTRGYVEFDLQGIFSSRDFAGFRAMYRLLHASRFIVPEGQENAPMDDLYEDSLAMGVRVGEDLRKNVQAAIETLASGFLTSTPGFLEQLRQREDGVAQLYRDILMTIYRMLFLLFAEQRGMLPGRSSLYMEEFSLTAFRTLAEQPMGEDRNVDLWEKIKTTIAMVEHGVEDLGIFAYNGALFSLDRTPLLTPKDTSNAPRCRNDHFLLTVCHLTTVEKEKVRQRISYADLSVEEIGSIYESLLEFTPRISDAPQEIEGREIQANTFFLDPRGSGRKTSGSYYTPPSLVNELIKSALVPVLEDRIRAVVPGYDTEYVEALTDEECLAAEGAILAINVVDPAAGSGAFLIAADNKLALELARVRTGDLFPAEVEIRKARRDVLAHCIYAVDLNPMAVELCKVSLWINAAVEDAPLNFLDHHIKCGNSLVGATPELIAEGIPNDAYNPVTGDNKDVSKAIKAQNREELKGQMSLMKVTVLETKEDLKKWQEIDRLAETDPNQAESKYLAYWGSQDYWNKRLPYDLWTVAFFAQLTDGCPMPTTQDVKQANISPAGVPVQIVEHAQTLARQYHFFHWNIEFPQVFDGNGNDGFDVVMGNPPWERVKLQEKEFFDGKDDEITKAPNAAARKRLIAKLPENNPALWKDYQTVLRDSEVISKFLRYSGKFVLTGRGDINLFQVFAELDKLLINLFGIAGIIVPTAIATGITTKDFFSDLVMTGQIKSLFDFENKKGLFPGVHRSFKFCLLSICGVDLIRESDISTYGFYLTDPQELQDEHKILSITNHDFNLLNPNTGTLPLFRNRIDADITRKIYSYVPIFNNQVEKESTYSITQATMFHSMNHAHLFEDRTNLEHNNFIASGNYYYKESEIYYPLYEGKTFMQYDHRFSNVIISETALSRPAQQELSSIDDHLDPEYFISVRAWVTKNEVVNWKKYKNYTREWYLVYKKVTAATNERTLISTILPNSALSDTVHILLSDSNEFPIETCFLISCLNSYVLDYITRQKIGGNQVNFYILDQLPILPLIKNHQLMKYIIPRVIELSFNCWENNAFADDVWGEVDSDIQEEILKLWHENSYDTNGGNSECKQPAWQRILYNEGYAIEKFPRPPFKWDNERRFNLTCELDALFGHLYNLTHDELAYILETFPIVKRKDNERYGEYRTKRVIQDKFEELVDDPLLDRVCAPFNERVSVLEHPEKEQPLPPRAASPSHNIHKDKSTYTIPNSKKVVPRPTLEKKQPKPKVVPENQPTLFDETSEFSATQSNYTLYKCDRCGKIVMGFSIDEHTNDFHNGEYPGYEKIG